MWFFSAFTLRNFAYLKIQINYFFFHWTNKWYLPVHWSLNFLKEIFVWFSKKQFIHKKKRVKPFTKYPEQTSNSVFPEFACMVKNKASHQQLRSNFCAKRCTTLTFSFFNFLVEYKYTSYTRAVRHETVITGLRACDFATRGERKTSIRRSSYTYFCARDYLREYSFFHATDTKDKHRTERYIARRCFDAKTRYYM